MTAPRRLFVHLAYLDDSDTKSKVKKWQVMAAVIMPDNAFKMAELAMAHLPERMLSAEKLSEFTEFHACELYGGYGPFEGLDQAKRFDAIEFLLTLLTAMEMTVVYGAVDLDALRSEVYGSADPVDVCFRKCLGEIKAWVNAIQYRDLRQIIGEDPKNWTTQRMTEVMVPKAVKQLIVLVVDECDPKIKNTLLKSFRSLRPSLAKNSLLECFHDDLYFGVSRYSIGIQLADLCSFFIAKHLEGQQDAEGFYQFVERRIYREEEGLKDESQSAIRALQQGNGHDSESRPESSESGDGDGKAGAGDGSSANGQAEAGPTA
jgi:hypothetical protein